MVFLGMQTIHLDACFIISYIRKEEDLHTHVKSEIESISTRKRYYDNIKICMSHTAVGEVTARILELDPVNMFPELSGLIKRLDLEILGPSYEAYEITLDIMTADKSYLGSNDYLIVAQALSDKNSIRLMTTEKRLIENDAFLRKSKTLKADGKRISDLKITDTFE